MKPSYHARRNRAHHAIARAIEPLEDRLLMAVFTVTNANDSGTGSLRWAIDQSNNTGGFDTIAFNLPSANRVIRPASELPGIWDAAIIDGGTQPGYVGRPLVQIDGANAGGAVGIKLFGSSTVKGLSITNFGGDGVNIPVMRAGYSGNTVSGNWIGIDLAGNAAGNNAQGVGIYTAGNTVDHNVISSSKNAQGVYIWGSSSTNNVISYNYIGTDNTGTLARGNAHNGVGISDAPGNKVLNNVISANTDDGIILVGANAKNTIIQGNIIGLDATGTNPLPNKLYGMEIQTGNNTIGGTTAAQRNIVSANLQAGIVLYTGAATANLIQGNYIGTDITGNLDRGNVFQGIAISGANANTIKSNLISGNNAEAIGVFPGNNNTIQANVIGFAANNTHLPNSTWGITLINGSSGNIVGGSTSGQGNWIAAHPSGAVFNGGGNTVTGNLSTPPGGTTPTPVPGSFSFSAAAYTANENATGGTVTITVNRTANTNVAASVNFATANNTATAGEDYTATSGTLNFAAGETSKTFTVTVINDIWIEADEIVNLTLSNPTAGATISSGSAALTIVSEDRKVPGSFSFSAPTYTVNENGGGITVTVNRSPNTNVSASVNWSLSEGTASGGHDFAPVFGTFNFLPSETSKTFVVTINNDSLVESNETFNLALSFPTVGAALGPNSTAIVTITDDDAKAGTTPPAVTSASLVTTATNHSLVYKFDKDVSASLSAADMYVSDRVTFASAAVTGFTYDKATNTATFTFAGKLPAGGYRALLFTSGVTDTNGNTLVPNTAIGAYQFDFAV